MKDEMNQALDIVYDVDVNIAVAKVAEKRGFVTPRRRRKRRITCCLKTCFTLPSKMPWK